MKTLIAIQIVLTAAVCLTFIKLSAPLLQTTQELDSRLRAVELAVDRHDQMIDAILAAKKSK